MREKVIKEILREHGLVFHIKYVYCGKTQCRKCPHGPYLYASRREGGKVKTVYMGRLDTQLLAKRDKVLAKIRELLDEYEKESGKLEEDFRRKLSDLLESLLQEGHQD